MSDDLTRTLLLLGVRPISVAEQVATSHLEYLNYADQVSNLDSQRMFFIERG